MMKKYFLFLYVVLGPFIAIAQYHSDLADLGYHGPVKQLITRFCADISFEKGRWITRDTSQPVTTLIESFNQEGNYIKKEIQTPYDTSVIMYTCLGHIKTGWTQKNSSGIIATACYSYGIRDSITEFISYNEDSSTATNTYLQGKNQHTVILEEKILDVNGRLTSHLVTYDEDDEMGRYWRTRTVDRLTRKTEVYEFSFLEKDNRDNPVRILVENNGKAVAIRLVSIQYYQE